MHSFRLPLLAAFVTDFKSWKTEEKYDDDFDMSHFKGTTIYVVTIYDISDYYKLRKCVITIWDRYVITKRDSCYQFTTGSTIYDNC